MLHAVICDDEKFFRQKLQMLFSTFCAAQKLTCNEVQLSVYSNPQKLLIDASKMHFDLILLDIGYDSITGIDVAKQLQKLQQRMILIYVTSMPEYSIQGYETNAFRYLLKKDLDTKFIPYLNQAFARLNHFWYLTIDYRERILPVEDIIFLEIHGREISVHFLNSARTLDIVTFNDRLKNVAGEIPLRHFLKVQKSHLVNPQHIQTIYNDRIILSDQTLITINRSTAKTLREQMLDWEEAIAWNI